MALYLRIPVNIKRHLNWRQALATTVACGRAPESAELELSHLFSHLFPLHHYSTTTTCGRPIYIQQPTGPLRVCFSDRAITEHCVTENMLAFNVRPHRTGNDQACTHGPPLCTITSLRAGDKYMYHCNPSLHVTLPPAETHSSTDHLLSIGHSQCHTHQTRSLSNGRCRY